MTQPQAATPAPEKPDQPGEPGRAARRLALPGGFSLPQSGFLAQARQGGIIYPFIVLFLVLTIWKGSLFADRTNLLEILDNQASYLIIAAAGTMLMTAGGVGPRKGVFPPFFSINSLIAPLAMSFVITGVASLVTNGNLIIAYSALDFANFARTEFLDVTTAAWTMIGVVLIFGIVLSRTIAGRYMYAAGSNAEAARLAGVRVQWIKLITFAISGGAAGLGGIIDASRVLSASSQNGGTALTFTVLAGIVVGGTSILGGSGAIWRTFMGVLFIAIIGNGFTLLAWNPLYEQITLGVILLLAVGGDAWSRLRTT